MANGDNVNEFENNDANEAAEAEAGEKLSKHQQKKRYKVNHAKLKKQKMINRAILRMKPQRDLEAIEAPQAENPQPEASAPTEPTNEGEEPAPQSFTRQLEKRIASKAVAGEVKAELAGIIGEAGVTDPTLLSDVVDLTQYYISRTIPENPGLAGENPDMRDVAAQFFEDSYCQ